MATSEPVRIYEGEHFSTYGRVINQIRRGGEVVVSGPDASHLNVWARHFTKTQAARLPQVVDGAIRDWRFAGGGRLRTTTDDVFDVVTEYGLQVGHPRPLILTSGPETSLLALSRELHKELAVVGVTTGILDHGVRDYELAHSWTGRYLTGQEHNSLEADEFVVAECVDEGISRAANHLEITHPGQISDLWGPGRLWQPWDLIEQIPVFTSSQTLADGFLPSVMNPLRPEHTQLQQFGGPSM